MLSKQAKKKPNQKIICKFNNFLFFYITNAFLLDKSINLYYCFFKRIFYTMIKYL